MNDRGQQSVVRASEVGQYVYCARSWWLARVQGVQSGNTEALRAGTAAHDRHGRTVAAAQTQRRLAGVLLAAAALIALAAVALALVGGAG